MKRIILFGAPGSGKGTQAKLLEMKYNYVKISTGDLIRAEVRANTDVGIRVKSLLEKGELVPDDAIVGIVKCHLEKDYTDRNGYILDGFPRTIFQAEELSRIQVEHEVAIYLKIGNEDIIVNRMLSRLTCMNCGSIYSMLDETIQRNKTCNHCGNPVGQRPDDNPAVVRNRIHVYRAQTKPVIDYYKGKGLLHKIDASASVEDVTKAIEGILN